MRQAATPMASRTSARSRNTGTIAQCLHIVSGDYRAHDTSYTGTMFAARKTQHVVCFQLERFVRIHSSLPVYILFSTGDYIFSLSLNCVQQIELLRRLSTHTHTYGGGGGEGQKPLSLLAPLCCCCWTDVMASWAGLRDAIISPVDCSGDLRLLSCRSVCLGCSSRSLPLSLRTQIGESRVISTAGRVPLSIKHERNTADSATGARLIIIY